jgi:site-specific DNA recombinase
LTEDQFTRLDRIFSDNSRKVTHSPGVLSTKYAMGGGITLCGVCGKRMTAMRHHDYTGLSCLVRVNGADPVDHPKRQRPDGKMVDTNRVTVNHDRLESLVLDSIRARLEKDGWESVAAERDPKTDDRIRDLEAESAKLLERQRRVNEMHLADEMDPEQHATEIQRIKTRRESISAEVANLHGMPVVAGLVRDGLDFANTELWTSERKCALLKGLGVRVYVDPWPEGVVHKPPRLASESDEERQQRLELFHREVMSQRVRIPYPSGAKAAALPRQVRKA